MTYVKVVLVLAYAVYTNKKNKKTLWPLFMVGVQLPQG